VDFLEWAKSPWGQNVPLHIAWFLIWVAVIAGFLFFIVHSVYLRYFAKAKEFASSGSPLIAARIPEHVPRHSLTARLFHWIMAASMFLMQRMTPQPGMDPAQQRMMNFMMPVMMGVFFFKLPAGLNLYYAESNLIMIAQQAIMNRTGIGKEMREIAAKRARKKGSS